MDSSAPGTDLTTVTSVTCPSRPTQTRYVPASFSPRWLCQVTSLFGGTGFANCALGVTAPGCQQSGGVRSIAPSVAPSVDDLAVGVKRDLFTQTAAGVDFSYRRYSNMWADLEVNRVYDATGTRVVGYANGVPQSILRGQTSSQAWREYKGVDFWVQGTPGNWDLLASYTLSFNTGTVDDYFGNLLVNPRFTRR